MERNSPREVWFIRHGESVANAGGVTMEAWSYPLSELGYRQSDQLASALPAEPHLIIHSPYKRARETAEPTMRRFAHVRTEEWSVQEVQYLDAEKCTGTTQDQRREMSREYWRVGDPHFAAPGAESFAGFIARVQAAIDALAVRDERHTFVFSHGQFMSALAWLLLSRPAIIDSAAMRRFYQFIHGYPMPNCAVLPLFLHPCGRHSLGGVWVPDGVETETAQRATGGLAGV